MKFSRRRFIQGSAGVLALSALPASATLITQSGSKYATPDEGGGDVTMPGDLDPYETPVGKVTWYADDAGSDSNDGLTTSTPKTFTGCLALADPGDVIRVMAGTYMEPTDFGASAHEQAFNPANSGTAGNPIVILSHQRHLAIVEARISSSSGSGGFYHQPAIGIFERNYITVRGFTIIGTLKGRGVNVAPATRTNLIFEYNDVQEGDREGDDNSLNWAVALEWYDDCIVRHNKISGLIQFNPGGDNSAACDNFNCSDNVWEYNYIDAAGSWVHSGFAMKAGDCHRNVFRYNIVKNVNGNDGGDNGAAFYMKADTSATKFCDDNEMYGNLIINCVSALQQNHNSRRSIFRSNTAYGIITHFYKQWQNNNVDAQVYNNIFYGDGGVQAFLLESSGSDVSPYIDKANYNCFYNQGNGTPPNQTHVWYSGGDYTLTEFRALGGITGVDVNSVTGNPLFTNAAGEDFTLQGGSPCAGTGEGGIDMGYTGVTDVVGPDWMRA